MSYPRPTELDPVTTEPSVNATTAIARSMVAIYKGQFGRGPTKVQVFWAGPDTLVCVLDDTFTPAERKLVTLGAHDAVRSMRVTLQHVTVAEFCAPIEIHTGRKVRAFHSSVDTLADGQAVELFVLHPASYTGEGRAQRAARTDEVH